MGQLSAQAEKQNPAAGAAVQNFEPASKPVFECPVCHYHGPFRDNDSFAGRRPHDICPQCGALERHRFQYLVMMEILSGIDAFKLTMLHFAPERFLRKIFASRFGKYETADLDMRGVDHHVDLQNLPFKDATYDFVFASHLLEHVPDDKKAIQEIRRIMKPGGLAVQPVPIVAEKTIECPEANPHEAYHMRAPGFDYYEKFKPYFSYMGIRTSDTVPEKFQPLIYEDRSGWPTPLMLMRRPMSGTRHIDTVPICRA